MALTYSDFLVRGLAADAKPTTHPNTGAALPSGWRFFETDTFKNFDYNGTSWVEAYGTLMPATNPDMAGFYMEIAQIAAPANPATGRRRLFVDSADGKIKVRTWAGSNVSLEEQGGAGGVESHVGLLSLFTEATY